MTGWPLITAFRYISTYPTLFQQFDIQLDVTETEIPRGRGYCEIACEIHGDKLIQPLKNWCITGQIFGSINKNESISVVLWVCWHLESAWSSRSFRAFSSLASLCFTNSTLPQGRKPQSPHFSQSYCSWAKWCHLAKPKVVQGASIQWWDFHKTSQSYCFMIYIYIQDARRTDPKSSCYVTKGVYNTLQLNQPLMVE